MPFLRLMAAVVRRSSSLLSSHSTLCPTPTLSLSPQRGQRLSAPINAHNASSRKASAALNVHRAPAAVSSFGPRSFGSLAPPSSGKPSFYLHPFSGPSVLSSALPSPAAPLAASSSPLVAPQPFSIPSYPCEKSAIRSVFRSQSSNGKDRSFFVCDVGVVERQYARFCRELPNVQPFYAVKCNPDVALLKTLAGCGSGFDVASAAEMEAALSMGVAADDIIFANPIKSIKDLRYAARVGVRKLTFDNADELYKVKEHHPTAECVIRLLPDDSGSVMRFGVKFGAPLVHVEGLLATAQQLGLKVIGTSFHIGSGCFDVNSYAKAIALCRHVFDVAERKLGMPAFTFLDLGGGFPGNPQPHADTGAVPAFEKFAAVIRSSLMEHFHPATHSHVRVIAEPGRYMATAYSTLFTHVQGKREEPVDPRQPAAPRKFLYYINDGVYGSFNCIMFDHQHPTPVPAYRFMTDRDSLDRKERLSQQQLAMSMLLSSSMLQSGPGELAYVSARGLHSSTARDRNCLATFFGPTCDSMDVIAKDAVMEELFVGDWLAFEQMGAYTNAAATTFNGMPKPNTFYARSKLPSPVRG